MDYSVEYLSYSDYRAFGGTLDIMPFNLFQSKAKANIDKLTLNRLQGKSDIPVEVKYCMYELIEGMAFDGLYKDVDAVRKEDYVNNIIYDRLGSVVYEDKLLVSSVI